MAASGREAGCYRREVQLRDTPQDTVTRARGREGPDPDHGDRPLSRHRPTTTGDSPTSRSGTRPHRTATARRLPTSPPRPTRPRPATGANGPTPARRTEGAWPDETRQEFAGPRRQGGCSLFPGR